MRLVGGASGEEGRVEVCLSGQWGTVCNSDWERSNAPHIICRDLGYQTGISNYYTTL